MKLRNVLVVYYVHNYQSLDVVKKCLRRHRVRFTCVSRSRATKKLIANKDLIITVGGDGTFLRTSHLVNDATPLLVVSSDISKNEGFFAQASKDDFTEKLHRLLSGRFSLMQLPRLAAVINQTTHLHLAVNEIFIGSGRPYHTALYTLRIGKRHEFQKSSGILIYTGAGSHAWAASAGGKREKLAGRHFHYLVREAYHGRLTKPHMLRGRLSAGQHILIRSSIHDGIVVVDSEYIEHRFRDGDVIDVSVSDKPLSYVKF